LISSSYGHNRFIFNSAWVIPVLGIIELFAEIGKSKGNKTSWLTHKYRYEYKQQYYI